MCQGFSHFPGLMHTFVLAKLATSGIRVNCYSVALLDCYIILQQGSDDMNRLFTLAVHDEILLSFYTQTRKYSTIRI